MKHINQKGISHIEIILIILIIPIAIYIYLKSVDLYLISKTRDQIDELVMGVHANYAAPGINKSYFGLNNETAFYLNAVPKYMIENDNIINPFGGTVILKQSRYNEEDEKSDQAFILTYTNLTQSDCVSVAMVNWNKKNSLFMNIGIFGKDYKLSDIEKIMDEEALLNSTGHLDKYGIAVLNGKTLQSPITDETIANYLCDCHEKNTYCSISWKYN